MERLAHGSILLSDEPSVDGEPAAAVDQGTVRCPAPSRFGYLFPNSPSKRLPDVLPGGQPVIQALIELGNSMTDPEPPNFQPADPAFDSDIASAYSYFGQFITHELVLESTTKDRKLGSDTIPLGQEQIPTLTNARTALLDLDSIYGPMLDDKGKCYPVPMKGAEMEVGFAVFSKVPGTDLPRDRKLPFTARIGDRRNDANLITSQMHLAFLRAHNALVQAGSSFDEAQRLLRQHFQWLVLSDYLPRVIDGDVLKKVREGRLDTVAPPNRRTFMPVEFSAAAFRFGHSMPRNRYNYNASYSKVRLSDLFLPRMTGYPPLLNEWIIDWKQFLPGGVNLARHIDTRLVQPLFRLIDAKGKPVIDSQNRVISLASLDLLRGYLLGLPTGQEVAKALRVPVMSAAEIEDVAHEVNENQRATLSESGLSSQTPLWFYILAEAAHTKQGLGLGPVGSTIVAAVLVGLIQSSTDSILSEPDWTPSLGAAGQFNLADLFKFAGVLTT